MFNALRSLAALGLVGTLAIGCAANAADTDAASQGSEINAGQAQDAETNAGQAQESEINADQAAALTQLGAKTTVFDSAVTWRWRQLTREVVAEKLIDGHVKVEFLGDAVDANTKVYWQSAPLTFKYQRALVTVDNMPDARNPNLLQHREFLVGLSSSASRAADDFAGAGKFSAILAIDATRPSAISEFLGAYNPSTQEIASKFGSVAGPKELALNLTEDASGAISQDFSQDGSAGGTSLLFQSVGSAVITSFAVDLVQASN